MGRKAATPYRLPQTLTKAMTCKAGVYEQSRRESGAKAVDLPF